VKIAVCAALVQNQLQLYLIPISLSLSKRTNLSHVVQRCNFTFNMTKQMLDTIQPCKSHCSSQHSTTMSWWSLQNCFSYRNKGHLWDQTWTELSSSSKVPSTSQNSLATSLSLLADRAHSHGNGPRGTLCGGTWATRCRIDESKSKATGSKATGTSKQAIGVGLRARLEVEAGITAVHL